MSENLNVLSVGKSVMKKMVFVKLANLNMMKKGMTNE